MSFIPIAFGAPLVLLGLVTLPAIWWLLRMTPPRPREESFPPLAILARLIARETTPNESPWWLTALRLLIAACVVFALSAPVLNPRADPALDSRILTVIVDNSWASTPFWDERVSTATRLIAQARDSNIPVVLALTADPASQEMGPFDADTALTRLNAAGPRPIPVDRPAILSNVSILLSGLPSSRIAYFSDGLQQVGDEGAFSTLLAVHHDELIWYDTTRLDLVGLVAAANSADRFTVTARRSDTGSAMGLTVSAHDQRGRTIATSDLNFPTQSIEAIAEFQVPFELRNEFMTIGLDGQHHAGALFLLDENSRRRRIGLLAEGERDPAQPLLAPLSYIHHALSPYADLVEPTSRDLTRAIPQLLESQPAVIIMSDLGTLPPSVHERLAKWVEEGGMLIRFAGPRLAAASADDPLLPVRLRMGERALGGAMSWSQPQSISDFPQTGPFSGLKAPADVTVTRQVLAEPAADLIDHTWVNLADGTPLVTGSTRGKGRIVLFHVSSEATWSNLPLSGTFVEMLLRLVELSNNPATGDSSGEATSTSLPPYRMISADGVLVPPGSQVEPLVPGRTQRVNWSNPPGYYGTSAGFVSHNLMGVDATLIRLAAPDAPNITRATNEADHEFPLKGPLFLIALALLAADTLALLWLRGGLSRTQLLGKTMRSATNHIGLLMIAGGLLAGIVPDSRAQEMPLVPAAEAPVSDADAIAALSTTRIAYVLSGNPALDAITRAGIKGLSDFLASRTAFEPGEPAGIDIETNELAFYPLIYWPIDASAPMPTEAAIARIDAYMQQGGTVLFDTRDQDVSGLSFSQSVTPETMRLREILSGLNVPPLEPVPSDHVLGKAFYFLNEFPGRFRGGDLWIEASLTAERSGDRPVRTGDGVTSIMITSNDFAGAWALDASGQAMLPTMSSDPMQRIYAFRAGVNILIYMLTGNYKSDQVHVPAILERLGQ